MENNDITMCMDVKLDVHNKRPDSLKFKQWLRCEVKIEAIKCLPCYLRVSISTVEGPSALCTMSEDAQRAQHLSVTIIVPGVSVNYANSRTKQHSYGLFWTQNRKNCCIYFALETETTCRYHMKWIKKSIKNLELYRQLMLEQTRNSRGLGCMGVPSPSSVNASTEGKEEKWRSESDTDYTKSTSSALGPLPQIPDDFNGKLNSWSHTSQIYEEILDGVDGPRLSRRISRTSIASGIYEEMKPTNSNFNVIDEEAPELPPLPPPRKRVNTYNGLGMLGEIPRSNTNPESDLAKKKKYKNMLENIFGSARTKRAESVSETHTCTAEDLINSVTPPRYIKKESSVTPIYANETVVKRQARKHINISTTAFNLSKRNSFSSPDLSKIPFCEEPAFDMPQNVLPNSEDFDFSEGSLNDLIIAQPHAADDQLPMLKPKVSSLESLNISQKISNNFNFSACNTSTINLIGANGATVTSNTQKNEILIDDMTGYCIMAPIIKKVAQNAAKMRGEPTSSGYSTSSSTAEEQLNHAAAAGNTKIHIANTNDSTIYETMHATPSTNIDTPVDMGKSAAKDVDAANLMGKKETASNTSDINFTENLYENLLAVKASQELEYQTLPAALSTSTPTDSPLATDSEVAAGAQALKEEENYYQTPRKSIISVDEKISSYYPNSCDTVKARRHHYNVTPQKLPVTTPPGAEKATTTSEKSVSTSTVGFRQFVSLKLRREHKENLYISSPQNIIEQRQHGIYTNIDNEFNTTHKTTNKTQKSIRASAMKIAEHVYTVKHAKVQKSKNIATNNNNNNETDGAGFADDMRERLQTELIQIAMLQKIDFKFDDTQNSAHAADSTTTATTLSPTTPPTPPLKKKLPTKHIGHEHIYENIFHQYKQSWSHKNFSCSDKRSPMADEVVLSQQSPSPSTSNMSLPKSKPELHHSCIAVQSGTMEASSGSNSTASADSGLSGVKKFASLPRFKKIDLSPLRLKINSVLQRGEQQEF